MSIIKKIMQCVLGCSAQSDPTTLKDPVDSEDLEKPFPERISKEEINKLPLTAYKGKIVLVRDEASAKEAAKALLQETVLGFDTETRPAFKKGESYLPALIQLGGEDCVYLFQNKHIKTLAPLIPILSNPNILKVGVAIRDDIKGLQDIEPFDPKGFVEISQHTTPAGIVNTGLRPLCGIFLGYRISKRAQVSNWGRDDLEPNQITYAATDAWISRELYLKIESLGPTKKAPKKSK